MYHFICYDNIMLKINTVITTFLHFHHNFIYFLQILQIFFYFHGVPYMYLTYLIKFLLFSNKFDRFVLFAGSICNGTGIQLVIIILYYCLLMAVSRGYEIFIVTDHSIKQLKNYVYQLHQTQSKYM